MRSYALVILFSFTSGCTFALDWFRELRASQAITEQKHSKALTILKEIVSENPESVRALEASRQGARLTHLEVKDYPLAIEFYKHVVLKSPDAAERKDAQRFIAQINFDNLQNFEQAVIEYEKLLKLENSPEETFRYRLNLAKSHYRLNNLEQTVNELDVLLEKKPGDEQVFEIKTLKANVLVSNRLIADAAEVWSSILKEFPEKAAKENIAMNLVVCYEELKDFAKAIEVLENMRQGYPNPKFLDLRIQRLKERQANLPGAQGWRK